jgi:putative transposase
VAKKKVCFLRVDQKKALIDDPADEDMSIRRQCGLLGLSRSSYYYEAVPVSEETLKLMNCIDMINTDYPFYGSRKITEALKKEGWPTGRERVQHLMRKMGIETIYPKPNLSRRRLDHAVYPYLLKGIMINRPNYVWSSDITYIRLNHGFLYLVAIIDWYSRYVLSWRLSNSLDNDFCIEALEDALQQGCPTIFNTDQGTQFTSKNHIDILKSKGIKISMDGKGRAFDNIFVERLWRTVKYEEVFIKGYETGLDAKRGLSTYFPFYNTKRFHQSLDYNTPHEVHYA